MKEKKDDDSLIQEKEKPRVFFFCALISLSPLCKIFVGFCDDHTYDTDAGL